MQKKSVIMNHSMCWTFFYCPMKHEFANIKKHTLILYGAFIMKCIPQLEPVMNHRKKELIGTKKNNQSSLVPKFWGWLWILNQLFKSEQFNTGASRSLLEVIKFGCTLQKNYFHRKSITKIDLHKPLKKISMNTYEVELPNDFFL